MTKGRKPTVRQLRVGEEIRHCLAAVLGRGDPRDPDLHGRPITVTEVRVSPNLREATVFVMPLGGEQTDVVLGALERAAPFLRGALGREIHLKYLPRLRFRQDSSYEEAERIDGLLRSPRVARDLADAGAGSSGEGENGSA
jgi:ribosome-binding factor A